MMESGNPGEASSEVARLMRRIDLEHQAACFALTSPAVGTAQHWFISRRMERIGTCQQQLAVLVGEQKSIEMVVTIMANSPEQKREADAGR